MHVEHIYLPHHVAERLRIEAAARGITFDRYVATDKPVISLGQLMWRPYAGVAAHRRELAR